jgi:NADH-quinone oxidoreductase subunit N
MVIYNIAVYSIFFTLFQFVHQNYKTIYSFLDLGSSSFFSKVLIIALFSMAGVPPFLGFFSKIFIFSLLCNSNFFILFPFFFILLFISLYFYIQNIRFLNSTVGSNFTPITEFNLRVVPLYYYLTFLILFFLTFGLFFTEDLLLLIS